MNQQVPIYNNTNIKPIQNYNNYNNSYPNSGQQSFYNQNYHQNYIPNQKMYYPNGQNNQEENPLKTFNTLRNAALIFDRARQAAATNWRRACSGDGPRGGACGEAGT